MTSAHRSQFNADDRVIVTKALFNNLNVTGLRVWPVEEIGDVTKTWVFYYSGNNRIVAACPIGLYDKLAAEISSEDKKRCEPPRERTSAWGELLKVIYTTGAGFVPIVGPFLRPMVSMMVQGGGIKAAGIAQLAKAALSATGINAAGASDLFDGLLTQIPSIDLHALQGTDFNRIATTLSSVAAGRLSIDAIDFGPGSGSVVQAAQNVLRIGAARGVARDTVAAIVGGQIDEIKSFGDRALDPRRLDKWREAAKSQIDAAQGIGSAVDSAFDLLAGVRSPNRLHPLAKDPTVYLSARAFMSESRQSSFASSSRGANRRVPRLLEEMAIDYAGRCSQAAAEANRRAATTQQQAATATQQATAVQQAQAQTNYALAATHMAAASESIRKQVAKKSGGTLVVGAVAAAVAVGLGLLSD